jgi:hypothetical protein
VKLNQVSYKPSVSPHLFTFNPLPPLPPPQLYYLLFNAHILPRPTPFVLPPPLIYQSFSYLLTMDSPPRSSLSYDVSFAQPSACITDIS